jgi:hypothetical protein
MLRSSSGRHRQYDVGVSRNHHALFVVRDVRRLPGVKYTGTALRAIGSNLPRMLFRLRRDGMVSKRRFACFEMHFQKVMKGLRLFQNRAD